MARAGRNLVFRLRAYGHQAGLAVKASGDAVLVRVDDYVSITISLNASIAELPQDITLDEMTHFVDSETQGGDGGKPNTRATRCKVSQRIPP